MHSLSRHIKTCFGCALGESTALRRLRTPRVPTRRNSTPSADDDALHQWDVACQQVDDELGHEVRTPLLSQQVIDVAMNMVNGAR